MHVNYLSFLNILHNLYLWQRKYFTLLSETGIISAPSTRVGHLELVITSRVGHRKISWRRTRYFVQNILLPFKKLFRAIMVQFEATNSVFLAQNFSRPPFRDRRYHKILERWILVQLYLPWIGNLLLCRAVPSCSVLYVWWRHSILVECK